MITIHCLAYSRAIRLVWLMADIDQSYKLIQYDRTEEFRAPDDLKRIHPLGKSPVIEDEKITLAESATCLRYLVEKFNDVSHRPEKGTLDFVRHEELLDYVESSFAEVALNLLLPKLGGKEPSEEALVDMKKHYDYVVQHLPENGLLFGKAPMLADIQFSYLLANLSRMGFLAKAPRLESYWSELQQQPGYKVAIAKAGPMAPEL